MAIVEEYFRTREDGVRLFKTYSDQGLMIRKVGTNEIYSEAIDIETAYYKYEETDQLVEINLEENNNEQLQQSVAE